MDSDDAARRTRAQERAARMTLRKTAPGMASADPVRLTPEQAVSLVHELTFTAWALSGRPLPEYTRDTIPIRIVTSKAE